MKLTKENKNYLLSIGHIEQDLEQIEEATTKTSFTLISKDSDVGIKIGIKKAISLLGREGFLSGLGRSAFHWSAVRETPDGKSVYFDSSKLFEYGGI